jgi:hypothetical protein
MAVTQKQLMGMTTNERLFESGLMNDFDQAAEGHGYGRMRSILRSVFVDSSSIELIVRDRSGMKDR